MAEWVGKEREFDQWHELEWVRARLASIFNCRTHERGLWGPLLEKLVQLSNDPDSEAASLPSHGTPLGILNRIPPGKVFPQLREDTRWEEQTKWDSLDWLEGASENYKSYEEAKQEADTLFQKELNKDFVDWSPSRTELEQVHGPLVPSAIGYISKVKLDGTVKGRLVHDLRRSGVNEHIEFEERLVLPRLKDALEDVLRLLEVKDPGEQVSFMSLDFSDAFKHLHVRPNERRFLAGSALGGWFVYKTVLFGIRTGPLVWGRTAALVARATQSLFHVDRCRLQVFVDDPLVVARGTTFQLADIFNTILMWWMSLGLKTAWKKGSTSPTAEWIGAKLTIDNTKLTVTVSVTAAKLNEWRLLCDTLETRPLVSRKPLQRFTGKMSWAAGFIPQLKPFVRMLHAALASNPNRLGGRSSVYYKQVEPALKWVRKFLWGCGEQGLERTIHAHTRHQCRLDFLVDASPWGGSLSGSKTDALLKPLRWPGPA